MVYSVDADARFIHMKFFFLPCEDEMSGFLAWCVALNLAHRYNFIFFLDVVLLFFWLGVV